MDYLKEYKEKLITTEKALNLVKSGDEIVCSLGPCEPKGFLSKLHTIKDRVENVNVVTMLSLNEYKYDTLDEMKGHFFNESLFMGAPDRNATSHGLNSYIPTHLRYSATKRLKYRKPNIFIGAVTPMDKHGFFSLSLSLVYERENIDNADIVIFEVNENLPRVHGDTQVHISEVDYILENTTKVNELISSKPSEKDLVIGEYISSLVEDGSTIQLGIGSIPNAVAESLSNKKDLGVHTEMITEGIVDLFNKGVITNSKKTIHPHKIIGAFALGSQKLYDFLDDNPCVELKRCSYVNDPYVISKNNKMISINTALAVDLTGQCASESIGLNQYSGTGGQTDTGVGAGLCANGKSIIALHSTAKNDTISTITPSHYLGSAISYSRNDVDYIVTEYGIASLCGKSIRERAESLIKIAHPKFRDELKEFAIKNNIL
ncbi:MAG: acetyl-CoA hydrolase/transferase family protein [Clostridium baratii]|uniref:acetyl-CoA hydrolase/transferase family protein n=1 Tax=Clostridium baratii TaxID=1561 RepID=UPI0006C1DDB9|nr:acetyl-CoA hydrolase/transferase C-terminal domain-containing protein [Clostridium baratii]MBS6006246.1 acetyl-CoA hydrolase/transferase family protein [Clostridium baratii]MDU4911154.1 acetyl-CoA hydrolase/transferase C-terminal domain-containing protein [Clostridium baratii]CUP08571.1 4-hydroxybutyrate CoA-transferase [Clostridium baratii]